MRNNYLTRRKKLGMTREQIAALANVSLSTIVRLETSKAPRRSHPVVLSAVESALAKAERKVSV
jgi:transcriptional regulator with XRE-family HTH domain